jgi:hypothetical protein
VVVRWVLCDDRVNDYQKHAMATAACPTYLRLSIEKSMSVPVEQPNQVSHTFCANAQVIS